MRTTTTYPYFLSVRLSLNDRISNSDCCKLRKCSLHITVCNYLILTERALEPVQIKQFATSAFWALSIEKWFFKHVFKQRLVDLTAGSPVAIFIKRDLSLVLNPCV